MAFDCTMGLNEEDKVWEDMRMESDTGFLDRDAIFWLSKYPLLSQVIFQCN